MKSLLRILSFLIVVLFITVQEPPADAAAQQTLTGEEALSFLQETGIYGQLAAEAGGGTSPAGREFFGTGPIGANPTYTDDLFGIAVARDGDTVLVGAYGADIDGHVDQGAAWVFKDAGGDIGWTQESKLTAADGAAGDEFGFAVALSGDTAVVGARAADVDGNGEQGAAYVFERAGVFWSEAQKLEADTGSTGDEFGSAVALAGGTALIGAPLDDIAGQADQGAVFVFTESGGVWSQQARLVTADTNANDQFGSAVALEAGTALIGAPQEDIGFDEAQGAAYVFVGAGGSWSQQARLVTGDGAQDDQLGGAVALSGDTAVVGAHLADVGGNNNQGAAYVYTRVGSVWSLEQKLAAGDGAQGDRLRRSVALAGDTVLVGAAMADIDGSNNQGAAYVFIRDEGSWSEQSKLADWAGGEAGDRFGRSVALEGDTALVGAIYGELDGGSVDRGLVHTYARGQVPWLAYGQATAADGAEDDWFGYAVAIDGKTILVGVPGAGISGPIGTWNEDQGAAYLFERSVSTWVQIAKLTAAGGAADDHFGGDVALDGETALVGAAGANIDGNPDQGAAYIFTKQGNDWIEQARLAATDGAPGDIFGVDVALDGDTAVVGAPLDDVSINEDQGAAYVFVRNGEMWSQQAKLTAADGAEDDNFGTAVALDADTALVGASRTDVDGNQDQGSTYVFTGSSSSWTEQAKLTATNGVAFDFFGVSVALDGDTALVGTGYVGIGGNEHQGAVYVFTGSGAYWIQQERLTAADGAEGDFFGGPLALEGNTILVGAHLADVNGNGNQGAAYLFTREGNGWRQQARLISADGALGDQFGISVALSGNLAVVGARSSNVNGNDDQGQVYFFRRQFHEVFLPVMIR